MRIRRCHILYAVAAVVLSLSGCTRDAAWPAVLRSIEATYPDVPRISTDSLAAWLMADSLERPVLLDTRTAAEYAVSHLKGAAHMDPDTRVFDGLDSLDRGAPIVAYCSVGYRSSEIAERLREAGFTNVYNLEGSIFRWANEGRPVYREGREVEVVHPFNAAWGRLLEPELRAD